MRFLILCFCLCAVDTFAQTFLPAPFLAMGEVRVAQVGLYSLAGNPAGLSRLETVELATAYQQHYMIRDLATQGILFGLPLTKSNSFGICLSNYGLFQVSSLLKAGFSWSRSFGQFISGSLSLNYHQYQLKNYQTSRSYSLDMGFMYRLPAGLTFGVIFINAGANSFDSAVDQSLLREIAVGFFYSFSEVLSLGFDLVRNMAGHTRYKSGLAYAFHPEFVIRFGGLSNPIQYTAGFGFAKQRWNFDVGSSFHSKLGTSPQLAIRYVF